MFTRSQLATASLLVTTCAASVALAQANPPAGSQATGYFLKEDGKTTNFIRIHTSKFPIRFGSEDKATYVPVANIKEILLGEKHACHVKLRDGRQIDGHITYGGFYDDFYYDYFDDVNKRAVTRGAAFRDVHKIVFDEPVGRFRRCRHCSGVWPSDFLYCPHDGTPTVWGVYDGALTEITGPHRVKCCPACKTVHRAKLSLCPVCGKELAEAKTNILSKGIDYFLGRAGVDPRSSEAAAAKRFSTRWLNPLASEDEILKGLREVVGEATKEDK